MVRLALPESGIDSYDLPNDQPSADVDHILQHYEVNKRLNMQWQLRPSGDTTGAADQTELQGLINAASTAGGGVVTVAPGQYWFNNHYQMKTGVLIESVAGPGVTTFTATNGFTGDAGFLNASWSASPGSLTTTETNYGIHGITLNMNGAVVAHFTYGMHFQRFDRVSIKNNRVTNVNGGSGIILWNGYNADVHGNTVDTVDQNGIYLTDVIRFRVIGNNVQTVGDFGIEIGSGQIYASTGGTAYCGDGVVVGNTVAGCVNFCIALRGFDDATANPDDHYVQSVTVTGNTCRDAANLDEIVQYELTRGCTVVANNTTNTGVQVREMFKYAVECNSGVDFTSAATTPTDLPGLTVTHGDGQPPSLATIILKVRAFTSVDSLTLVRVAISPAPLDGLATVACAKSAVNGFEDTYHVIHQVWLAANVPYTIKGRFEKGTAGNFTARGSSEMTSLTVSTTPLF